MGSRRSFPARNRGAELYRHERRPQGRLSAAAVAARPAAERFQTEPEDTTSAEIAGAKGGTRCRPFPSRGAACGRGRHGSVGGGVPPDCRLRRSLRDRQPRDFKPSLKTPRRLKLLVRKGGLVAGRSLREVRPAAAAGADLSVGARPHTPRGGSRLPLSHGACVCGALPRQSSVVARGAKGGTRCRPLAPRGAACGRGRRGSVGGDAPPHPPWGFSSPPFARRVCVRSTASTIFCSSSWCERGDSNPHGFTHRFLKPARLPVPPLSREGRRLRASL